MVADIVAAPSQNMHITPVRPQMMLCAEIRTKHYTSSIAASMPDGPFDGCAAARTVIVIGYTRKWIQSFPCRCRVRSARLKCRRQPVFARVVDVR